MKKMTNRLALAALVLMTASLTLIGCQNNAGLQVQHDPYNIETNNQVTDYKFGNKLIVSQIIGDISGGLHNGNVVIKNTTKSSMNLQYQFTWYDQNNREMDIDGSAWTPITVYAKNQKTLSSIAPNPTATQFRVSIRELNATKVFKTNLLGIK